jgi:hypothetical protein
MTPTAYHFDGLPWTVLDARSGVQDAEGVWRRDDEADVECLSDAKFALVRSCCEAGIEFMKTQQPQMAHDSFVGVLEFVTEPVGRWNAVGWALLGLGHVHVSQNSWVTARQALSDAMWSPGVFGNPWAHRLKGQTHLALGERERALDDFTRAVMGGGTEVLKGTGPEVTALLEQGIDKVPSFVTESEPAS